MGRPLHRRLCLIATVELATPLHVGGLGSDPDSDMPLARNGRGQICIPGTSLAGALRAWCQRTLAQEATSALWGYGDGEKPGKGWPESGIASAIVVGDAVIENPVTMLRDSVGIDRVWGCAADRIKYDRIVLSKGTRFRLELTVDVLGQATDRFDRNLDEKYHLGAQAQFVETGLLALLGGLLGGAIRLGAAKTRGLGRLALGHGDWRLYRHAMDTPAGILGYLADGPEATAADQTAEFAAALAKAEPGFRTPHLVEIEIDWQPTAPVMMKQAADGMAIAVMPLTARDGNREGLLLAGSAIKGVLRAQAQRIADTFAKSPAFDGGAGSGPRRFLNQMAAHPLVEALFGAAGKGKNKDGAADPGSKGPLPGLGALAVDDCMAIDGTVDRACWRDLRTYPEIRGEATANDRCLPRLLAAVVPRPGSHVGSSGTVQSAEPAGHEEKRADFQRGHHVVVDRWTGGAAQGLLYDALEPWDIRWDPMHLQLDLDRLPDADRGAAVALLLFALRDLAEGWITLGYGGLRGFGEVKIDRIQVSGADIVEPARRIERTIEIVPDSFVGLPDSWRQYLERGWTAWCEACR